MKIKEIKYFKFKDVKEVFCVYLDDDNVSRIQFTCKGSDRTIHGVYVTYTSGRHMTYNHTRIPKKYNKMFNESIKDYPTI